MTATAYSVAGDGPALVMIHGIGARRATFEAMVDGLRDRFTCVSYDLRGHGLTPGTAGFGLDDLVDDLAELLDRLGIRQAHVAGHSLGGMIGPAYARRHPERVRSLGLWSTAAFRTADDAAAVRGVVAAMRERGIGPVLDTLTARWFTDAFAAARPDVIEWRTQQVLATDPDVFLTVFDVYAGTEMGPWLHELAVPTQIITGEHDGGCNPRLNRLIQQAIPGSELEILPDLKHAIFIERTEAVLPHVRRFLTGLEDVSPG
jgi:pimeloyl-ACP methyl ester carboxylesterase